MGEKEDGDYDVLKHQLNSAALGTREQHCPEELHFQDHFPQTYAHADVRRDGDSFSLPFLGIPTLFLGPATLVMVQIWSGGNLSVPFAGLDWSLVWRTLNLGECDAAVLCDTAFSLAACASCDFEDVFLV